MSEIRVTHREKSLEEIHADKDQHGNLSYWVGVAVDGVEEQKGVLVRHKGDRPVMEVSDTFEQHGFASIQSTKSRAGNEYFKAVRPSQNGNSASGGNDGGGYGSPESRAERESTGRAQGRAHAHEMALRYVDIKSREGAMPEGWTKENLLPIIDWFYNDAQAAKDKPA